MSQSASSSDAARWTSSRETCARPILTSRTRHAESRKRSIMPAAWPWGSGPRGERPDYTGLDVIIVHGDKIAALYVFLDSMPS